MNIEQFKNIFRDCELINDKILIKSRLAEVIQFIKENYHYELLKSITAVDNGDYIELIYMLYSLDSDESANISIFVKNEIESISSIFDSATADEKEIYDLFGINFIGNSELKRIYMPESWQGHPLRKDYVEKDERLVWND